MCACSSLTCTHTRAYSHSYTLALTCLGMLTHALLHLLPHSHSRACAHAHSQKRTHRNAYACAHMHTHARTTVEPALLKLMSFIFQHAATEPRVSSHICKMLTFGKAAPQAASSNSLAHPRPHIITSALAHALTLKHTHSHKHSFGTSYKFSQACTRTP